MLLTPTLSRAPESDAALDQARLYAEGLDHLRRLSRQLWTDHNTHDPGITILELLSYALTDLSYRACFPIEDLLASAADNATTMGRQFCTPRQVLPNRPLTVADYRKLLVDIPGLKNAWLSPAPPRYFADTAQARLVHHDPGTPGVRPVDLRGFYRVQLEYADPNATPEQREQITTRVREILHANRNLCEEFAEIAAVETQRFALCAEIDLAPDADATRVSEQLFYEVNRYLAPPVEFRSLAEMLARRHVDGRAYTLPEIFTGPVLTSGFIDDEELARSELRSEIRLSDIVRVVMAVEGVRAVRDIVINALDADGQSQEPVNKWCLPVAAGQRSLVDTSRGRLVFYKRNLPVPVDRVQVEADLKERALRDSFTRNKSEENNPGIPLGRFRNPGQYRSFQHHFPAVYGLSDAGLPAKVDVPRASAVLQLKGYLLFFDQLMADLLAQLAHTGDLFSHSPSQRQTYFAQVVRNFKHSEAIYKIGINEDQLTALVESQNDLSAGARRNRFLDHLLARFGEEFHHYVAIMRSAFGTDLGTMIDTKCEFLESCPTQGGARGLAYNRALGAAGGLLNSQNVSGLERRLARLLGIRAAAVELRSSPEGAYVFAVKDPRADKAILAAVKKEITPEAALIRARQASLAAQRAENYRPLAPVNGRHGLAIAEGDSEALANVVETFASEGDAQAAVAALVDLFRQFGSGEELFLIENILLRPPADVELFLPICADLSCADCGSDDPYSYRIIVVLPATAGRFHQMDFRRFVEETVRQETPAHILPKICWIDAQRMATFLPAFLGWKALPPDATDAQREEKLRALLPTLMGLKNIYPKQKLHGCGGGEDQPPFVLGRSQLGSED